MNRDPALGQRYSIAEVQESSIRDLCVVSSTLQLVNCVEFLGRFPSQEGADLLVVSSESNSRRIIDEAQDHFGTHFRSLAPIPVLGARLSRSPIRAVRHVVRTKKALRQILSSCTYSRFVFGHSGDALFLMGYLAKRLRTPIVIVDDGAKSLSFLSDKETFDHFVGFGSSPFTKAWYYHLLFGSDGKYQRQASYFTLYASESIGLVEDLIENDYAFIRSAYRRGKATEGVIPHFLGQPLLDYGLIGEVQFDMIITRLKESLGGAFLYFPHPRETVRGLDGMRRHGVQICPAKGSYELHYLTLVDKPTIIGSFFSSAIPVLAKLKGPGTELRCYDISSHLKGKGSGIKRFYRFVSDRGLASMVAM